jgi:hypothetical protein
MKHQVNLGLGVAAFAMGLGCDDTQRERTGFLDERVSVPPRMLADTLLSYGANDEHIPLYNVRTALWTPHGLVIANSGAGQILVVDESGQLLHALGRVGSGPGEFRSLSSVWSVGERL